MHKVNLKTRRVPKTSKSFEKLIQKAEKEVNENLERELDLVNCSLIIALNRYWNYKTDRILKILNSESEVWDECGADKNMSMIRKCDEECDIELTNEDGISYRTIMWLNAEDMRPLNDYEWLRFRQNQKKWSKAQMLACTFIALKRTEGWSDNRLAELMARMDDIRAEFEYDPQKIIKATLDECGYDWEGSKIKE